MSILMADPVQTSETSTDASRPYVKFAMSVSHAYGLVGAFTAVHRDLSAVSGVESTSARLLLNATTTYSLPTVSLTAYNTASLATQPACPQYSQPAHSTSCLQSKACRPAVQPAYSTARFSTACPAYSATDCTSVQPYIRTQSPTTECNQHQSNAPRLDIRQPRIASTQHRHTLRRCITSCVTHCLQPQL